ncbi:unnamed protein product [Anisakis simplex]|uniref:Uncharacterized protein n=1 Tax=Anisakis simplex TaxID=6269 RepID=A0A0M3JWN6_ANISI|nr:unnamed protein product [Anisakis simplex]
MKRKFQGSHLHRDAPSRYQDGVYMLNVDLPSARAISDLIFKGPSGIPNARNVTTMLAFFSEFFNLQCNVFCILHLFTFSAFRLWATVRVFSVPLFFIEFVIRRMLSPKINVPFDV